LTIISFDCGFGVMQVTSGAANYPGLEARADINVAAGADILARKWNSEGSFGGTFGDSDPAFLESWYFAVWAYNGFVYGNNPNNPEHPPGRPPFNSPGSLSRGSYPYQEIVWGYLGFPQSKEGEPFFEGVDVTYPTGIPDRSGLFSVALPLPDPAHADPCVEECPPAGCPPADRRTVVLDDADPGFSLEGDAVVHDEGGFRGGFRSAAPARPATVRARWTATAPASGVFDVGGFVPLDPASNEGVVVTVQGRGAPVRLVLDQGVPGGAFAFLGRVELQEGARVTVVVDNDAEDQDPARAIGFDAFRLVWRGDGAVADGGACADSVDCAGDRVCSDGVCVDGCDVAGCVDGAVCDPDAGLCRAAAEGEGEGDAGEGEGEGDAGAGEGEGEGDDDDDDGRARPLVLPVSVGAGCGCAAGGSPASAVGVLMGLWALRRRRRR